MPALCRLDVSSDLFLDIQGLQATQFEAEAKQLRCRLTQCEQQMKVREQMLLDLAADDTDISQQQSSSSLSALMETTIIISPDDEKKQRLLGLPVSSDTQYLAMLFRPAIFLQL